MVRLNDGLLVCRLNAHHFTCPGWLLYQDEITEIFFPPEPEVAITDQVIDVSSPSLKRNNLRWQRRSR